jgi:hypothetical protein
MLDHMAPRENELAARALMPACDECWGCTTQLRLRPAVQYQGHVFEPDIGKSQTQVLLPGTAWRWEWRCQTRSS